MSIDSYELISREDAREKGLKFFVDNIPCAAGHISERYVRDGRCCACIREKLKASYAADPTRYQAQRQEYEAKLKAKLLAAKPKYVDPNAGTYEIITREEAIACGLRRYRTGQPCAHMHFAERFVANKQCCVCSKEKNQKAEEYRKQRYLNNIEKIKEKERLRYWNNRDRALKVVKAYAANNKDKRNTYQNNRRREDVNYRLGINLRVRMWSAINKNQKTGSAVRDLGCSVEEFKSYIESKFRDGMNWENWSEVWELDHIEACCSLDLSNREQFLKAAHYTNYQPLLMEEHNRKTVEDRKKSIRRTPKVSEERMAV